MNFKFYIKIFLLLLNSCGYLAKQQQKFCWSPGINPFSGTPTVTRVEQDKVKILWEHVFMRNPPCSKVDFLIKSHPRFTPSAYKLSDFTTPGKGSALIRVDGNVDYVFQVIARENKGPRYGIEYKYSQLVTSYASDFFPSPEKNTMLRKVPQTRNLPSSYPMISKSVSKPINSGLCSLPIVSKESDDPRLRQIVDRIMIAYMRHMNTKNLDTMDTFFQSKKSCNKQNSRKGFVTNCMGVNKCCSNPLVNNDDCVEKCFSDFGTCDGKCFPRAWLNDGWPDCLDGSDEMGLEGLSFKLQCVQCSGVVLTAKHLCSSSHGVTDIMECINEMIGQGECNVCIRDFLSS